MLTGIKKLTILAVMLAFSMPVMAKVTPVHKYKQGIINKSTEEANTPCSAHGMYTTAIKNANCTLVTFDKQKCYQCTCPPEYQFTCSATGFVPPKMNLTTGIGSQGTIYNPFLVLTATGGNNAGLGGVSGGGVNTGGEIGGGVSGGGVYTGGVSGGGVNTGVELGGDVYTGGVYTGGITSYGDALDAACTIPGSTPLYKTCDCATGYLPASSFTGDSHFSYNGTEAILKGATNGLELKCMQYNSFVCNRGVQLSKAQVSNISGSGNSTTFTANDDIPFITYKAASLLKETTSAKNSFCVTGASVQAPLRDSATRPNGTNDCAKYVGQTAKHYPSLAYGYFDGDCSDDNFCTGSSLDDNPCVLSGGDPVTTLVIKDDNKYSSGSVTCRHAKGCNVGIQDYKGAKVLCTENLSSSPIGFNVISSSVDTAEGKKQCARVGCHSEWTQAFIGSYTETLINQYSTSTPYTFDTKVVASSDQQSALVCRYMNGCDTNKGWYNFACSTSITSTSGVTPNSDLCWQGYLSYWLPGTGSETKPCTIENCSNCDAEGKCLACNLGYKPLLDSNNNITSCYSSPTCSPISNCAIQNPDTCECATCEKEYVFDAEFGVCMKCADGYVIQRNPSGKDECVELNVTPEEGCIPAIEGCLKCSPMNSSVCIQCEGIYSLKEGTCVLNMMPGF